MEDEEFQLRFSFKFEGASEVFFAFAIPFSYDDTQVLPCGQERFGSLWGLEFPGVGGQMLMGCVNNGW